MIELKNNIYFCGLNDEERPIFDELIPLEHGTTYNSYYIKGSEKNAIIDTMYPLKSEEYIANLKKNNVEKVDYIIANHGEQDHSGTLPQMIELYPEAKIVTNSICKNNLVSMLLIPEEKIQVIKTGDEISLGDKTLRFITAPGVHWPDTMFTYVVEDNVIFTCDFLGAHKTFEDPIADESEELISAAKRYYAEIMMPFRAFCQKYTKMIKEMNVDMILPSHGPVYKNPDFILNLYEDWASDESKNLVLLPYVSMYGSTLEMIDYLEKKLTEAGIQVKKYNIINGDLGEYAMSLVDAKTIVVGASMVLMGPHPNAYAAAYLTAALKPKAKYLSVVGSFGWGGNLVEKLAEPFVNSKIEILEPVLIKGRAKQEDFVKLDELINTIIDKHRG